MQHESVLLTGHDLSFEEVRRVAQEKQKVKISTDAVERLKAARDLVISLGEKGSPIYGLNTGVGWNKDKKVANDFYDEYNRSLLRSHMVGVNPECTIPEIRANLLIRLNGFLCGHTGVSPKIAQYYEEFLNHGIHPIIKKRGSVGAADIGTLSAVGLTLIGEGEVIFQGKRMPAKEALQQVGLQPLMLGPKDGLSIISSNAQSAALAGMAVLEIEQFLKIYHQVFCLSLEGYNGVMDPIEESVNAVRGYKGQMECSRICRTYLEGSYLLRPNEDRALQDPLSFRCHCAVTGAVLDAVQYLKEQLSIEINSTDDNPCLLPLEDQSCGSANFVPLPWVLALEMVGIGLNHLSKMICNRMIRLSDPAFTKLPRFLSPNENKVIAFGTIQKTFAVLDSENRMYANPSSMDFMNLSGQIEDHGSNASMVAEKVRKIIDNLYYMTGMELMHGAQAVDLRKPDQLGKQTRKLYENYRKVNPFLREDRILSIDIQNTYTFLKNYSNKGEFHED